MEIDNKKFQKVYFGRILIIIRLDTFVHNR